MVDLPEIRWEELAREKLEGKSYSEIRAELAGSGLTEEEVSRIIRKVDEIVLKAETGKKQQERSRLWYRAGLFLAVLGLIIAIAFNAGIILENLSALLVYSPFLAGILVMLAGKMMRRRQPGTHEGGPGPIRKRSGTRFWNRVLTGSLKRERD
jgi:hypothetical protein